MLKRLAPVESVEEEVERGLRAILLDGMCSHGHASLFSYDLLLRPHSAATLNLLQGAVHLVLRSL